MRLAVAGVVVATNREVSQPMFATHEREFENLVKGGFFHTAKERVSDHCS